jgi:nicotinamidase-related amidase
MKALIIIDVQKGMFGGAAGEPHDGDAVVARIAGLLAQARESGTPVFFVQNSGPGGPLDPDGPGFAIVDALAPLPGESVTVKTQCNSFQDTDFEATLRAAGISHLIVTGMQSEYCFDTAVRAAFERGFKVTIVEDGHTTFDTPALSAADIIAHHNHMLGFAFAWRRKAADIAFG